MTDAEIENFPPESQAFSSLNLSAVIDVGRSSRSTQSLKLPLLSVNLTRWKGILMV